MNIKHLCSSNGVGMLSIDKIKRYSINLNLPKVLVIIIANYISYDLDLTEYKTMLNCCTECKSIPNYSPRVIIKLYEDNLDKVDWHELCTNKSVDKEFFEFYMTSPISKYKDKFDQECYNNLCENDNIPIDFLLGVKYRICDNKSNIDDGDRDNKDEENIKESRDDRDKESRDDRDIKESRDIRYEDNVRDDRDNKDDNKESRDIRDEENVRDNKDDNKREQR